MMFLMILICTVAESKTANMPATLVHAYYNFETNTPKLYNIDAIQRWENTPALAGKQGSSGVQGVFSAFQFQFENGSPGYMGTSIDSTGNKWVVFSIWDAGNVISTQATGMCHRFGNEGTGVHCGQSFNWQPGINYKLRIWKLGRVSNGDQWGAWITDLSTNKETLIGVIIVNDSKDYQGYGSLIPWSSSWIEFFGYGSVECSILPYTRVVWNGPWVNNNTITPLKTNTKFNEVCPNSNESSTGKLNFTQEVGGTISHTYTQDVDLWVTQKSIPSSTVKVEDCVFNWAEKLYPSYFPGTVKSTTNGSYYSRYYPSTDNYIGVYSNRMYYISRGSISGNNIIDLGSFENWKKTANCQ